MSNTPNPIRVYFNQEGNAELDELFADSVLVTLLDVSDAFAARVNDSDAPLKNFTVIGVTDVTANLQSPFEPVPVD